MQVAAIGVGGQGIESRRNTSSHPKVKIVALCDVDQPALDAALLDHPGASTCKDWRELLGGRTNQFDAVLICTPDQMHAAPAVTALRAKKHLYLQKPMAGTLHECRIITQEAARAGVVTQLGIDRRSRIESRMTVDLIRGGVVGRIKEVILWENKALSWWPTNEDLRRRADPIPPGFNWDLWLGVREPRPYLEGTYHPKHWRAWFGFGVGEMGDMGCHHFDTSFDALKLTAPLRVRQTTPGSKGPLYAKERIVEMIFPGSEITADSTVKLTWYDGTLAPKPGTIPLPKAVSELTESGAVWIGERGTVFKNYRGGRPYVLPEENFPAEKYPRDYKGQNHFHDWVDAILDGRKGCADFAYGGPLSETVLVGAMADRFASEWLEWDSRALRFPNNAKATALIRRTYRDGWKVPGLG